MSIPAIDLNTSIIEISPTEKTAWDGSKKYIWEPVSSLPGHFNTSGYPGEGRNIVFIGHNNIQGEVFKRLDQLNSGDKVLLFTENGKHRYKVKEKIIIPYLGNESAADLQLQAYAAPQSKEMVTLISCWPYAINSHRIVVIAKSIDDE
jgi:sortase A